MPRAFELAGQGQIALSGAPIGDDAAVQAGGQTWVMVVNPKGPFKFRGGRVAVMAVDPKSGKITRPANPQHAGDKEILDKYFKGRMGLQDFEPERESSPFEKAASGQAPQTDTAPSLMALTPNESFERKLNEAYGPKLPKPTEKCPKCGEALTALNSVSGDGTCAKCGPVKLPVNESFERKLNGAFGI